MRKPQRMPYLMADCQCGLLGYNIEYVARGVGRTGLVVAPTKTADVSDPTGSRGRKVVGSHHHTDPPAVVVSSCINQSRLSGIFGRHVDIERRKVRRDLLPNRLDRSKLSVGKRCAVAIQIVSWRDDRISTPTGVPWCPSGGKSVKVQINRLGSRRPTVELERIIQRHESLRPVPCPSIARRTSPRSSPDGRRRRNKTDLISKRIHVGIRSHQCSCFKAFEEKLAKRLPVSSIRATPRTGKEHASGP